MSAAQDSSAAAKVSMPEKASAAVGEDSRSAVLKFGANELVFAVVGHVGSGTSTIAEMLTDYLRSPAGGGFDAEHLRARKEIEAWAELNGKKLPETPRTKLNTTSALQDLGDEMRFVTRDNSAVARA